MLDKLFGCFKGPALHRTAMLTQIASNVVKAFEQEYQQDHNAKHAAIDAFMYLLQQYKADLTPPVTPPAQSAAPAPVVPAAPAQAAQPEQAA